MAAKYYVFTKTSDEKDASSNGDVGVVIHGAQGALGPANLDNKANNFERGLVDGFVVEGDDLGQLESVEISSTHSWAMDWAVIAYGENVTLPFRMMQEDMRKMQNFDEELTKGHARAPDTPVTVGQIAVFSKDVSMDDVAATLGAQGVAFGLFPWHNWVSRSHPHTISVKCRSWHG